MKRPLLATLPVLACACAQAPGPDTPRPEAPARFALRGFWEDARGITFRVTGEDGPLPKEALRDAFLEASTEWGERAQVGFRLATHAETPDVLVSWGRGSHGACPSFGSDTSVAHAGPPSPGTFLHLDAGRAWTTDPCDSDGDEASLAKTMLHEMGHLIGLDHGPDPESLMYSDPSVASIARSDRDAIHTLYGGGAPKAADLIVAQGNERVWVLYGIAPPELTDFELFDTDGDGDDELVLWRTDDSGEGEIVAFHFASGPRPQRTMGPRPGMVGIGSSIDLVTTPAGERLLVIEYPNGRRFARAFDDRGRLVSWSGGEPPSMGIPRLRRRLGDLDGDGVQERLQRSGEN